MPGSASSCSTRTQTIRRKQQTQKVHLLLFLVFLFLLSTTSAAVLLARCRVIRSALLTRHIPTHAALHSTRRKRQGIIMKGGGMEDGMHHGEWIDLQVAPNELRPEFSLNMGQCFNWRRKKGGEDEEKVWIGVLGQTVLEVKQTEASTWYRQVLAETHNQKAIDMSARLRDYFQVETSLGPLYARWGKDDGRMKCVAEHLPGVRVVRQDPVECLFSFICSSNNNIPRIVLMLDRLRQTYGAPLGEGYHAFPSVSALAAASEDELRKLGLGYRARFIKETAMKLEELGGEPWLVALRGKGRKEAQEALTTFPGVGRKVADCVALFSLDQYGAIPVDVHVWRIACRDYAPQLKESKSLTPSIYESVGDIFREKFGPHAGWAHSLLFAAELPNYRIRLPLPLQQEMLAFKKEESEGKALKRAEKKQLQQEKVEGGRNAGAVIKKEEVAVVVSEKKKKEKATSGVVVSKKQSVIKKKGGSGSNTSSRKVKLEEGGEGGGKEQSSSKRPRRSSSNASSSL